MRYKKGSTIKMSDMYTKKLVAYQRIKTRRVKTLHIKLRKKS